MWPNQLVFCFFGGEGVVGGNCTTVAAEGVPGDVPGTGPRNNVSGVLRV